MRGSAFDEWQWNLCIYERDKMNILPSYLMRYEERLSLFPQESNENDLLMYLQDSRIKEVTVILYLLPLLSNQKLSIFSLALRFIH